MNDIYRSIVFYLLVATFVLFLSKNIQIHKGEKISTFLVIMTLSLVAGFRALSVGVDTSGYYTIISQLRDGYETKISNVSEQGFLMLSYVLMKISTGYTFAFCVYSIITNTLIILRFKDYGDKISLPLAVFVYYMLYYFTTFNTLRQWIAMSIIFYCSRYLESEKNGVLKYSISVFIATMMHSSAVLAIAYIPLYFLLKPSMSKGKFIIKIILSISSILGITYMYDYFMGRYGDVYASSSSYGAISLVNIFRILFFIFIIIYENDGIITIGKIYDKEKKDLSFEMLLYFIGIILTLMVYFYRYADRIGQYYILFETISLASFAKKEKTRTFTLIFAILLCSYLRYNSFMTSGYGEIPYIPFWKS